MIEARRKWICTYECVYIHVCIANDWYMIEACRKEITNIHLYTHTHTHTHTHTRTHTHTHAHTQHQFVCDMPQLYVLWLYIWWCICVLMIWIICMIHIINSHMCLNYMCLNDTSDDAYVSWWYGSYVWLRHVANHMWLRHVANHTWLRIWAPQNYRSLVQKSPIKETIFC